MKYRVLVAFAAVACLLLAGSTTAAAVNDPPDTSSTVSSFVNYTWADVDMYNCADSGCTPLIRLHAWQPLDDFCYVVGRYVGTSPYWDYVYDRASRHYGYVPEYYLANSTQSTHC